MQVIILAILRLATTTVSETADAIPWWTMVTGIIAIPAAVLAIAVSYVMVKKTRLESRKLELEIAEKESLLGSADARSTGRSVEVSATEILLEDRRVQDLILRSILLLFILQTWNIVERLVDTFIVSMGVSFAALWPEPALFIEATFYWLLLVFKSLPSVGYYLVLTALGGPILIGILKYLDIGPSKYLMWLEAPRRSTYIIVATITLLFTIASKLSPFQI